MNYVVDKVKEEQKEDVSILTHPLSCFYTLLVDFPLMGASRPKGLYVFRYRLLSYTNTWDCSSMLNLHYSALPDIIQCISIYQTLNKA